LQADATPLHLSCSLILTDQIALPTHSTPTNQSMHYNGGWVVIRSKRVPLAHSCHWRQWKQPYHCRNVPMLVFPFHRPSVVASRCRMVQSSIDDERSHLAAGTSLSLNWNAEDVAHVAPHPSARILGCIDFYSPLFRWLVLLIGSSISIGSAFCFDQPSVLQTAMVEVCHLLGTHTRCSLMPARALSHCHHQRMHLSSVQYNLFYSVYSWTNVVMVLVSGIVVDKV
jgi:hypothetical protein